MSVDSGASFDVGDLGAKVMDDAAQDEFLYCLQQASLHCEAKDFVQARSHLEKALKLNPDDARVKNLLGDTLFQLGHYEEAKAVFYALIDEFPSEAALFLNLATVAMRQGHLEEAEDSLQTLLQVEPKHLRAHSYLGVIYRKLKRLEESRAHFLLAGEEAQAESVLSDLCDEGAVPPQNVLSLIAAEALELFASDEKPFRGIELEAEEPMIRDGGAWENVISHFPRPASNSESLFSSALDLAPKNEAGLAQEPCEPLDLPAALPDELGDEPAAIETTDLDTQSLLPMSAEENDSQFEPIIEEHLPQIGFQTPEHAGSDAWLFVEGRAYIRSSILVAATGALDIGKSEVPATSNVFLKVEGHGKCLVRVPHVVASVRDVHWISVRASALAGFEGDLAWHRTEALGTAVMQLSGSGSVLLNSPQRAIIAKVDANAPLHIRKDMFLAWSRDVSISEADLPGVSAQHVKFEGEGMVIMAGSNLV